MTKFVWSIDDAGSGGAEMIESFNKMSRFLESRGTPGTWFVVPMAGGQPLNDAWCDALHDGLALGQDIQLHGRTHGDCFEFGPPNYPATKIVPSFVTDFEARREQLLPRYETANLRAWIEEGLRIFDERLGITPVAFRAPCGAISKGMFAALAEVGIGFHSCMYISASGYEHLPHLSGVLDEPWDERIPHQPYRWYSGVIELPILNEYTWRGAHTRGDEMIAQAKRDLDRIVTKSAIVVILMHTHGIADNYDYAFRVVDTLLEHVGSHGYGEFATMAELIASGEAAAAATVDGPDILEV